jgi:hypothetical protein
VRPGAVSRAFEQLPASSAVPPDYPGQPPVLRSGAALVGPSIPGYRPASGGHLGRNLGAGFGRNRWLFPVIGLFFITSSRFFPDFPFSPATGDWRWDAPWDMLKGPCAPSRSTAFATFRRRADRSGRRAFPTPCPDRRRSCFA